MFCFWTTVNKSLFPKTGWQLWLSEINFISLHFKSSSTTWSLMIFCRAEKWKVISPLERSKRFAQNVSMGWTWCLACKWWRWRCGGGSIQWFWVAETISHAARNLELAFSMLKSQIAMFHLDYGLIQQPRQICPCLTLDTGATVLLSPLLISFC